MLTTCSEPGCTTMVMGGGRCLEHDSHPVRSFPRGRPFVPASPKRIEVMRREAVRYAEPHSRSLSELQTP